MAADSAFSRTCGSSRPATRASSSGTNFYLTWYPTYLREYRHLSLAALGLWATVPLFAGMIGDLTGGSLSDVIFHRTSNARSGPPRRRRAGIPARCGVRYSGGADLDTTSILASRRRSSFSNG